MIKSQLPKEQTPVHLVELLSFEAQLVQTVGIVEVLDGINKGKMQLQEHTPEFSSPIKVIAILPPGFNEVPDEVDRVHEVEGDGRPVGMLILEQVKEGCYVGEYKRID